MCPNKGCQYLRESPLEADCEKNPLPYRGLQPESVLRLAFLPISRDLKVSALSGNDWAKWLQTGATRSISSMSISAWNGSLFVSEWTDEWIRPLNHHVIFTSFTSVNQSVHSHYKSITSFCIAQSSGATWESRWPSWAPRPNEPYGFCGRREAQLVPNMSADIRGH